MNVVAYAGCDVLLKPANAKGIILQEHSYMDGMSSSSAERVESEEPQMPGVRIAVGSPGDAADATACMGAASDMIKVNRIKRVIFLKVEESK